MYLVILKIPGQLFAMENWAKSILSPDLAVELGDGDVVVKSNERKKRRKRTESIPQEISEEIKKRNKKLERKINQIKVSTIYGIRNFRFLYNCNLGEERKGN